MMMVNNLFRMVRMYIFKKNHTFISFELYLVYFYLIVLGSIL